MVVSLRGVNEEMKLASCQGKEGGPLTCRRLKKREGIGGRRRTMMDGVSLQGNEEEMRQLVTFEEK